MRIALAFVALVALVPAGAAFAEDGDDAVAEAAQRVEAAVRAGDAKGLEALAKAADPSPWLVADALLATGRADAARAFAGAVPGREAGALKDFALRPLREPADARARLAAAQKRLREGEAQAVLDGLKDGESISDGVLRVVWLETRAMALQSEELRRDAAAEFRSAATIAERLGWSSNAGTLWGATGFLLSREHDYAGAKDAWQRCLEVREAAQDARGVALTLSDLGAIDEALGATRDAVSRFRRALERLPADSPAVERAMIRVRLGKALLHVCDYSGAFDAFAAALPALESSGAADAPREAYLALCSLHRALGDLPLARAWAKKALEAAEAAGPDQPDARADAVIARVNLASVAAADGDYDSAWPEFVKARDEFGSADDRRDAGRCEQAMSDIRVRQRRFAEARSLAVSAAAQLRDAKDVDGALAAEANLAEAEEGLGHRDEALRLLEQTVASATERGLAGLVLEYCGPLARLRLAKSDAAGAMAIVEKGIEWLEYGYRGLDETTRVAARARYGDLFQMGMRAALAAKDDARLFRYVEASRAAALLDALENRNPLRRQGVPAELERRQEEATAGVAAAQRALEAAGDDRKAIAAARIALEGARSALAAIVDEVQRRSRPAAHVVHPQPIPLEDAVARLAADEAEIVYAVVGDKAYAIVLTHAGARPALYLETAEVAGVLSREALAGGTRAEQSERISKAASVLWAPVGAVLPPTTKRVYVAPDGDVGLLPFAAFVADAKPRLRFTFVPSATTLDVLSGGATRSGKDVLGVAVAHYGAIARPAGSLLARRGRLADLPAAESEVKAVADGDGDKILLDATATEEALDPLLVRAPRWSAIHFALHGYTNRTRPSLSWLAMAPSPASDGYLTAFEIFQKQVSSDLVFLAACDSGAGAPVEGEGLAGLVRSFLFAGCPRVVANLWSVDDDAALAFSKTFHAAWKRGSPLDEAMEAARAELRKKPEWRHPYYWAGWCAWGLGR